jgi:phage anti-repressor protein
MDKKEKSLIPKISLLDFLKRYTAGNEKFIVEYYKFYEACENVKYGIEIDDVLKYLGIINKDKFIILFRKKFTENVDYIREVKEHGKKMKGDTIVRYKIPLDIFEKICLESNAKKASNVRDYL